MKAKSKKEQLKEIRFIQNQKLLNYWAGKDVTLAWIDDGDYQECVSIGKDCQFDNFQSFLVDRLATIGDLEKAAEEMNFTDAEDLLEFFFEYGTDETALEQLVDDVYDGQDMKDY